MRSKKQTKQIKNKGTGTMLPKFWREYGFSYNEATYWINAGIENPFVAVLYEVHGIDHEEVRRHDVERIWRKCSIELLWQVACNNNIPGTGRTLINGTMRPIDLREVEL